jgi:hypothetical protein
MKRIASAALIAAIPLVLIATPVHAGHYIRVAELCSFWCAEPERPIVSAKAKINSPIDRHQFSYELDLFPDLIRRMAWMVNGEVGKQAPVPVKIVQLETAFNRAQARGQSLTQILLSVKEDAADGYYAADTYCQRAAPSDEEVMIFQKNVLDPVMHGSNLSDIGFGPMTGNASANVAAHQFAHGTPGYRLQDGDSYFLEGPLLVPFPEISPDALGAIGVNGEDR